MCIYISADPKCPDPIPGFQICPCCPYSKADFVNYVDYGKYVCAESKYYGTLGTMLNSLRFFRLMARSEVPSFSLVIQKKTLLGTLALLPLNPRKMLSRLCMNSMALALVARMAAFLYLIGPPS
jgi:hypothetical protein